MVKHHKQSGLRLVVRIERHGGPSTLRSAVWVYGVRSLELQGTIAGYVVFFASSSKRRRIAAAETMVEVVEQDTCRRG